MPDTGFECSMMHMDDMLSRVNYLNHKFTDKTLRFKFICLKNQKKLGTGGTQSFKLSVNFRGSLRLVVQFSFDNLFQGEIHIADIALSSLPFANTTVARLPFRI